VRENRKREKGKGEEKKSENEQNHMRMSFTIEQRREI
jgi:hypothetical protein